jgi:hypothetical protein
MRWSHLHGDMQDRGLRSRVTHSRNSEYEEGISEIPCRVSSDPHEWCNELDAVSGRDSAKLQYL